MTLALARSSLVTPRYMEKSLAELRLTFEPWVREMASLHEVASPEPVGIVGTSALSGIAATRLQQAGAVYTEATSAKLLIILENYINRQVNSEPKIEAYGLADDKGEQARMEALLHFLEAVVLTVDADVQDASEGPGILPQIAKSYAWFDKCVIRVYVENEGGEARVVWEVLDPMNTYHDIGRGWPRRVAREWTTDVYNAKVQLASISAKHEYPWPDAVKDGNEENTVKVAEVLCEERNADGTHTVWRSALIDGHCCGEPEDTGLAHLNIFAIPASSAVSNWDIAPLPTSDGRSSRGVTRSAIISHASPFWSALKHPQKQWKAFLSTIYEGVALGLAPVKHISGANIDASRVPEEALRSGGTVFSKDDENLKIMTLDQGTAQIGQMAQLYLQTSKEQFDEIYEPTLLGHSNPGESGYLNHRKTNHAKSTILRPAAGCTATLLRALRETLDQFMRLDGARFTARAVPAGKLGNRHFMPTREYRAGDLPKNPVIDVEWPPDLGDEMQKIAAAQQLKMLGVSTMTVMADVLDITNPQEEMERRKDEDAAELPGLVMLRVIRKGRREVDALFDRANVEHDPKKRAVLLRDAHRAQADVEAFERTLPGSQDQGTPQAAPGIDNTAMPPQMGPNNPNEQAGALGLSAVGMGGQGGAPQGEPSPGMGG